MGLGLGMGIQMGNDGRFYASMGGVTMPGGGPTAQAPGQENPVLNVVNEHQHYNTAGGQSHQNSPRGSIGGGGGLLSPINSHS